MYGSRPFLCYNVTDYRYIQKKYMKKILVTGGTVFVSKYVAGYFRDNGYEVYVLNRNTKPQLENKCSLS